MARPRKTKMEARAEVNNPVEASIMPVDAREYSKEYLAYKSFLAKYAQANPVKYESKKEALLAKLNQL